jgi:hypothetical protein
MDEKSQKRVREKGRLIEAVPDFRPDGQIAFSCTKGCRSFGSLRPWAKVILDATGMAS